MTTTAGVIYFIQPYEFRNTNKFKIGMSQVQHFKRIYNGYKKGTMWISAHEVENPCHVESLLKIY